MKSISIARPSVFEKFGAHIINRNNFVPISNVQSILTADEHSLVLVDSDVDDKILLIINTRAKVIICDFEPDSNELFQDKCFIVSANPLLLYAKVIHEITKKDLEIIRGIHPSAVVYPLTHIPTDCFIGANCYIGNCEIGAGTVIYSGCHIYDGVKIGKNVIIDSGVVIGSSGFGFVRDVDGTPYRLPQFGNVIIEDQVEIGANTCIDRGELNNSIIRNGAKIDNLVQIAYNVEIGRFTYIMGHTVIAGDVKVGEKCWIAPSFILNKVKIGNNVTVGFGSVILKSIKDNSTVMGNPSISLEYYSNLQYKLRKLY